jgi:plastocyanin
MKTTLTLLSALLFSTAAYAADGEYTIIIKDHKFEPARVEIPADTRVKLIVKNQDATPEEFESHDLKREKIIKGNSEAKISVGPLKAGEYKFFGEFNEKTAQGVLVVK